MKIVALVSGGVDNSYHSPIVQSFIDKCAENDCRVLWFQFLSNKLYEDTPYSQGEMNIFNLINYGKIDAIVIMSLTNIINNAHEEIIIKAKRNNVPVISIDGDIEGAYNISLGYEEALAQMVSHVIEVHGAKDIKFVSGMSGFEESEIREAVFRIVMDHYNLPVTEDSIDYGNFWWSPAEEVVQRHYDKHGSMPDAFVCANDSMAIGVMGKLHKMGFRVPEDVIVTGIDGIPEGNTYNPPLTTLMRGVNSAGVVAAERTLQIINKEIPREGSEILLGDILYRGSCGCEKERKRSDDNELKHSLYEQVDLWNGFSDDITRMSENATVSNTFEEALESIKPFLSYSWSKEAWLCICDNFITETPLKGAIKPVKKTYQTVGYTPTMKHIVNVLYDSEFRNLPPFRTEDMLPDFDEVMKKYNNITFMPIHFRDRTIGYFALEFTSVVRNYHILHSMISNVSRVLENARVQLELKSVVDRLEDMYIHDPLTPLYNRRGFYQLVPEIYDKCVSDKAGFMIISIDLDNLKGINDTYGHHEGDNAIMTIANGLLNVSDGKLIIARFGGDEYIVAGRCPTRSFADDLMTRFKAYLERYNESSGKPYKVSASCGVYSVVPMENTNLDEFIKLADELMYTEKAIHRKHLNYSRGRM